MLIYLGENKSVAKIYHPEKKSVLHHHENKPLVMIYLREMFTMDSRRKIKGAKINRPVVWVNCHLNLSFTDLPI